MIDARDILIDRIKREIIGPGSDIFLCSKDFCDEVIEGKPLTRYYSSILFPPKTEVLDEDQHQDEDEDPINLEPDEIKGEEKVESVNIKESSETDDEETIRLAAKLYYPTKLGLTFCVPQETNEIDLQIKFGTYKKALYKDLRISYSGEGIDLLSQYGFQQFIDYNYEGKYLILKKELKGNIRKNKKSEDFLILDNLIKTFITEISRDHILIKHIKKLVYGKDKWQRTDHDYKLIIDISDNSSKALNQLVELKNLPKNLAEGINIYIKAYTYLDKKFAKILLENKAQGVEAKKYIPSNEKLNQSCLFQVEMVAHASKLLPFNRINENKFLSEEDRTLNFLYGDVKSFGIGHGVACEWKLSNNPAWIKTSFFPQYDIQNQSTKLSIEDKEIEKVLNIKNLSSFSELDKNEIIDGLLKFSKLYENWITDKSKENENSLNKEIGLANLNKCSVINQRIQAGIRNLETNDDAFRAFQFANAAMYMQMFHSAKYFGNENNKGFELYEWNFENIPTYDDYNESVYPSNNPPQWRPFQLGFILLSIDSIINPNSQERKLVDLIWFPTGGGKTEAYLAVTALLIFYRRLTNSKKAGGVNAIIRYTLRLLTAQQFERATKIILACEKVRRSNKGELGKEEISIGFWVGKETLPNNCKDDADKKYNKIMEKLNNGEKARNTFQINTCQWCNTKIITKRNSNDNNYIFGLRHSCAGHGANHFNPCLTIHCNNPKCDFSEENSGFPIVLIDEDIYKKPPTLLFGTIDKFAMLAWREEGRKLFNQHNDNLPPELIIQDELHLISGPLGSLAGLYENVIQSLCTKNGIAPKIIASTATTKNVDEQVKKIYGKRVSVFPPFALNTKDNFFSRTEDSSIRRYIGVMPTGKNFTMTQLKSLAALLYARLDVWLNDEEEIKKCADNFWTIISYFNSLKDVGKMANKIGPELRDNTLKQLHNRLLNSNDINYRRLNFAYELTSRIASERIKETLDKLQFPFDGNLTYTNKVIDLVLATNMISVGLDVQRLGVMLVNGMPRNIAEYIQSTSRVARKNKGIVLTLLNPDNSRDLSYFEHFISFHQKFYKEIEPLSLTPFTVNTLDKMLLTSIVTFFRHKLGYYSNDAVRNINKKILIEELMNHLIDHCGISSTEKDDLKKKLECLLDKWENKVKVMTEGNYKLKFKSNKHEETFLKTYDQKIDTNDLITMQSVRNVEPSTKIKIQQY